MFVNNIIFNVGTCINLNNATQSYTEIDLPLPIHCIVNYVTTIFCSILFL